MSKRIIVEVVGDDAASRDAVALGVRLAETYEAELVLASIWCSPLGAGDATYELLVRDEMQREMRVLHGLVPAHLHSHTVVAGATSTLRGLHRITRGHDDDVLVFSAGHLRHPGHRNIALDALHDAPCAVAVAPVGYEAGDVAGVADVAVAWDESPESHAALEEAVRIAEATGATLRLITVLYTGQRFADEPYVDAAGVRHWLESLRPLAQAALDRGVAVVGGRVPVSTSVREGIAGEELAAATRDAAVVVTGSRGFGTLHRVIVGSTTADLLEHATVPVLVLPRGIARESAGAAA